MSDAAMLPVVFYWAVVNDCDNLTALFRWDDKDEAEKYATSRGDAKVHAAVIQGVVTYRSEP